MITRRTVKFPWLPRLYQVRTDQPWWRRLLALPFEACQCWTHPYEECVATWRLHPDGDRP